jgi:hypothetical protein
MRDNILLTLYFLGRILRIPVAIVFILLPFVLSLAVWRNYLVIDKLHRRISTIESHINMISAPSTNQIMIVLSEDEYQQIRARNPLPTSSQPPPTTQPNQTTNMYERFLKWKAEHK